MNFSQESKRVEDRVPASLHRLLDLESLHLRNLELALSSPVLLYDNPDELICSSICFPTPDCESLRASAMSYSCQSLWPATVFGT